MPQVNPLSSDRISELSWIRSYRPFHELTSIELELLLSHFQCLDYDAGEIVYEAQSPALNSYFVISGKLSLTRVNRIIDQFTRGGFLGELGMIDDHLHTSTVRVIEPARLLELSKQNLDALAQSHPLIAQKIFKGLALYISKYVSDYSSFFQDIDVLLVQDGGCAPGYNPVTAFITEYLEKKGRKVFIVAEGFRSLVRNQNDDYRCLVSNKKEFQQLDSIPGVIYSRPLREARGAAFRSERYPEFKEIENQKKAAASIIARNVKCVIAIGGNGTFAGIRALGELLPKEIKLFFVPVTIDSDVSGSDCIGEFTGIEMGAEKIRCYLADANTHARCYIIEMMGRDAGFHALHSCLGAGADLAVLPGSELDLQQVAQSLNKRGGAVIVVAEGYKKELRKAQQYQGNAAEFFRDELKRTNVPFQLRLVCESFSRDIRGAAPNNLDIMLSQRMASKLSDLLVSGQTRLMPAVLSGKDYSIAFEDIVTSNSVKSELALLANKLT